MGTETIILSLGTRRPKREADYCLTSHTGVKMRWGIYPPPPTRFHVPVLKWAQGQFAFAGIKKEFGLVSHEIVLWLSSHVKCNSSAKTSFSVISTIRIKMPPSGMRVFGGAVPGVTWRTLVPLQHGLPAQPRESRHRSYVTVTCYHINNWQAAPSTGASFLKTNLMTWANKRLSCALVYITFISPHKSSFIEQSWSCSYV